MEGKEVGVLVVWGSAGSDGDLFLDRKLASGMYDWYLY
jgi:hypothetical protein